MSLRCLASSCTLFSASQRVSSISMDCWPSGDPIHSIKSSIKGLSEKILSTACCLFCLRMVAGRRVGRGVTTPTPHRTGRAELPLTGSSRESFAHGGVMSNAVRDSLVNCQFSYPLTFRVRGCEAQSPLPFPVSGPLLATRRPPSLDRVTVSPVPRRRQYYEGATTSHSRIPGHLFVSLPGTTRFPPCFVLAVASAPERMEVPPQAKIIVQPVISNCRRTFAWTRVGPLRFPGDPSCASAPFQDPGRTYAPSPITVASSAAPAVGKAKAPAC